MSDTYLYPLAVIRAIKSSGEQLNRVLVDLGEDEPDWVKEKLERAKLAADEALAKLPSEDCYLESLTRALKAQAEQLREETKAESVPPAAKGLC